MWGMGGKRCTMCLKLYISDYHDVVNKIPDLETRLPRSGAKLGFASERTTACDRCNAQMQDLSSTYLKLISFSEALNRKRMQ